MHANPPDVQKRLPDGPGPSRLPIRNPEMEDEMTGEFEVLVAAASPESRSALTKVLLRMGLRPAISSTVQEARAILSAKPVSLVFCEDQFADGNYRDVLRAVKRTSEKAPVVVSSRSLDWYEYLEALRLGAFEYFDGPVRPIDVEMIVRYAYRRADASERQQRLRVPRATRVA